MCFNTKEPVPDACCDKVSLGALYETKSADNAIPEPDKCVLLLILCGSCKFRGKVFNISGVISIADAEINPLGSEPLSCV